MVFELLGKLIEPKMDLVEGPKGKHDYKFCNSVSSQKYTVGDSSRAQEQSEIFEGITHKVQTVVDQESGFSGALINIPLPHGHWIQSVGSSGKWNRFGKLCSPLNPDHNRRLS